MINLTPNVVRYALSEEGLVLEAYLDSENIWTCAGGVAATSGYNVLQWKDRPMSAYQALQLTVGLMKTKFLPRVAAALDGHDVTEAQLAGMLSFCWRHGFLKGDWLKAWKAGDTTNAFALYMQWTNHGTQTARAARERNLIFHGLWPQDMRTPVYSVDRSSHKPVRPVLTDLSQQLQQIIGGR